MARAGGGGGDAVRPRARSTRRSRPASGRVRPYEAVVRAVPITRAAMREARPDVVVHDILTLAPALAAELQGVPSATVIPHVHPTSAPGAAPYSMGARLPRTAAGRRLWTALRRPVEAGWRRGRDELNETRRLLGLPPLERLMGGVSERLCLVASFPQLEYPRPWPAGCEVIGPLLWEPPYHDVAPPPGPEPLVLIAPSTAQDPEHRLLRAAVEGLADEPVRVLAALNRRPLPAPCPSSRPASASSTGSPTRGRCPVAPRSSPTPATALSCARSRAGRRCSPCRTPATWARTRRGSIGPGSGCGCRGGCSPRPRFVSRCAGCSPPPVPPRARGNSPVGPSGHDPATRAAELVEALAAAEL